jgi:hypothetical protein
MKLICLIISGRSVSATLVGDDVDDDRLSPLLGLTQGMLHIPNIVPVDRTQVFDIQV